jgi:hypothetical protein
MFIHVIQRCPVVMEEKFINVTQKPVIGPWPIGVLNQFNPVHLTETEFCNNYFNIIHSVTTAFRK